jgi:hypothetical protein
MLPQRSDVGIALSRDDEVPLLEAMRASRSPSLYPFFILSLDAGLRPSETRSLRRFNLRLNWREGMIEEGEIIVGASKTEAGAGRIVPLTRRACAALAEWLSRFPDAGLDNYVLPFHRVAIAGNERKPCIYDVRLDRPMSDTSYQNAFETARRRIGIPLRFYDARHTFVTRLAENPAVSEETIRQLAGHVSPRMLGRYAHIRVQARRDAIASLEIDSKSVTGAKLDSDGAQNGAQSPEQLDLPMNRKRSKSPNFRAFGVGSPGRIRTSDMTVNSRPLYRLSYRGAICAARTLLGIRVGETNQVA